MNKQALFEIGLEELPARFIDDAEKQLEEKTAAWLQKNRLPSEQLTVFSTPRRLAVLIDGLPEKQPDIEEKAKGPAKHIALTEDGEWSKAAIGFTKGQGKNVDDIYFEEIKGVEYVHVDKYIEGVSTEAILQEFKDVILSLTFPKNMRWGNRSLKYVRPIRWLVALFEEAVIPFEIEGVETGAGTKGHRFLGEEIILSHAGTYESALKGQYVMVDRSKRMEDIKQQLVDFQQSKGWDIHEDEELLMEVTDLVEYPTVFSGSFDESFLKVPDEALITSMKEHQRYFPVHQGDALLPYFVGVRNGDDQHLRNVARGNEKVLRARLSDAQFFYEEDQKVSIEARLEKLQTIVYQEDLGTLADKVARVEDIALLLSDELSVSAEEREHVERAAHISKFDLVTQMVDEFTNLQGIMGEKYAKIFGESDAVAAAMREQYMPKQAGSASPETKVGSILSVADKLDTIVGTIAIGNLPSGSQDPYGLRRQALGILQIVGEHDWEIDVTSLLDLVIDYYKQKGLGTVSEEQRRADIHDFFDARAAYLLRKEDVESDIVEAVLVSGVGHYPVTRQKAILLSKKRNDSDFREVHESFGRVLNMAGKAESSTVDSSLFEKEEETRLHDVHLDMEKEFRNYLATAQVEKALETLTLLAAPIHEFFDNIMVMTEDSEVRANRLALLKSIADTLYVFADFHAVQWKQHN
ncbi:glycine--tRNA ligase subunit beta [Salimicrobium halophilum]|uniref:Glycine--tRNA ligase beta subunit n=1 Tax=Salimicrobium halophilum TaxID=86666 RepID=A0A1G8PQN0_9BACI|nr:glycine--tRNA ligase subunit beta [Salimicrobium halophilum]SDI94767.1 glycyl-tRNA synthetase beta chain [Salimicrobium halophilum]